MFKSFVRFSAFFFSLTVGIPSGFSSSDVQDALVVASARIHGYLPEVARYCKPDDEGKFLHFDLAPRVTTIDLHPVFGNLSFNGALLLPEGHRHVQADARTYKEFKDSQFDLIFMELPASCNVSGVADSDVLNKTGGMYDHIAIIPKIIRNLASKLKPGGRLEIEHLPLMCSLSVQDAFAPSNEDKSLPNIASLIQKDPFTIYHAGGLGVFINGLKKIGKLDGGVELLKAILSDKSKLIKKKDSFIAASIKNYNKYDLVEQAVHAELRHLNFLQEAIEFRANKEGVFKEVMVNLLAHEILHDDPTSCDSYFRMVSTYAHLLDLRAHIGPLKAIMEPLGLKDVAVKVKKESYNGRLNPWFIVATKSGNPSATK